MLNWLHANHTARGARAPQSNAVVARITVVLHSDEPQTGVDLGKAGGTTIRRCRRSLRCVVATAPLAVVVMWQRCIR